MPTHRVLIADDMSPRAVEILTRHPELQVDVKTGLKGPALVEALRGVEALVVRSATKVTSEVMEGASSLRVIGRAGIGVDNIDVKAASRRGVIVMNTPAGNAITTAEHAICLLCSLARHIPQATATMKAGKWEKKKFEGHELFDKTLGILGLGNIGRIVADRAIGLRMKVIGFDPVLTQEAARALGVDLVPLDEVFRRADFITVHTPLLPETKNLVSKAAFEKMKKGVLLINAARGGIVDEAALLEALREGKVAGAALDVFSTEPPPADHPVLGPLLKLDNVIATPHLGASTEEAQEKVAVEVAEQIADYLLRAEVRNALNLQALPRELQGRLGPWLDLAGRLGALAAQLQPRVESIEIEATGDVADQGTGPMSSAAIAGILRHHLHDVTVNEVNSRIIAGERGIRVSEVKQARGADFTSSLGLRVSGNGQTLFVRGTVFQSGGGAESRVVEIDSFLIEASPEGRLMVIRNDNKPGVIGAVGTLLGGRGINVSRMQVGLDHERRAALQLWNIDGEPDAATVAAIGAVPNVRSASLVVL